MAIRINGTDIEPPEDARVSLLDLVRERRHLTGTKVGCNQGACGACTVLIDGERALSCLTLAVQVDGRSVTTIEGLGSDGLNPLQAAFLEHDGFQCGYCTPGQICSAVAVLDEIRAGIPSHVQGDVAGKPAMTVIEMRERMSGNICRCGAYSNIADAMADVAGLAPAGADVAGVKA